VGQGENLKACESEYYLAIESMGIKCIIEIYELEEMP
jgi:hypothetical protein